MVQKVPRMGKLCDFRLPHILTFLQRQKLTGTLTLHRNDQIKVLYLIDGDIVFSASQYSDDRLGEFLLKAGIITLEQYEHSAELVLKTGKRQGAVLVEEGYISPKELVRAVTSQVHDIILSLFPWINGDFRFVEGPLPTKEVITLKMSTANMILGGVKRINDWTRLYREIPPMDKVLRLTSDPLVLFQDVDFEEGERKILTLMNGERTIRGIFSESNLNPFGVLKIIHFLVSIGAAYVMQEAPEAVDNSGLGEQEEVLKKAFQHGKKFDKSKILKATETLHSKNHYEVLGISKEVGIVQIKKAYYRLAKEYHPDRHFDSGMDHLKDHLERLFHRITQAYRILIDEVQRRKYDFEMTEQKLSKRRTAKPDSENIERHVLKGRQALKQGNASTAVFHFEHVVRSVPDNGAYHALLARALSEMPGRVRDAEAHYKKAIEMNPAEVKNYIGLGLLYKRAGMFRRALRQFEETIKWDADHLQAQEEVRGLKKKL